MAGGVRYREIIRELALDQYGYVTTKQASAAGVPSVELPKLAARGGLENIAYGLYRLPDGPATPFAQYAEALLRAGDGSYLHGESVLALFGLADVNPRRICVAVRRRTRPRLPSFIELTLVKDDVMTTQYEGLESQRVADALLECRGRIERGRLVKASDEARKAGLMTTREWRQVSEELRS